MATSQSAARALDHHYQALLSSSGVATALLHHLGDEEDPASLVKTFVSAVPPGSHLVLSHYHPDALSAEDRATAAELATAFGITMAGRPR